MSQLTPFASFGRSLQPATPAPSNEHEVSRFFVALLRRKRLFFGIIALFVALVATITLLTPKSYTTTVRLMASEAGAAPPSAGDTSLPILNALLMQNGVQTAETFSELVQQQNIAETVAKNLGLTASPQALLGHLTVTPVVNTAILNLSVTWSNPDDAARIANEFASVFTQSERALVQSQATQALQFLSDELPRAEARMNETASELADFQEKNGFVDASNHTQQMAARDGQIQERIETLMIDRREAQALLKNVQSQMAAMPHDIESTRQISVNPVLADLNMRLEQVESQLATARKQYTDQHPAVIALVQQRDALRQQISQQPQDVQSGDTVAANPVYQTLAQQASNYSSRIDGDAAQLSQLNGDHQKLERIMRSLPQEGMQLATLQQRARLASDVYQALEQKYNSATIARTTALSDVAIVQPATAQGAVQSPNLMRNLMVAPILGTLIAALTIFVLDYLERKVRNAGDVRNVVNLPVIATIPSFATTNRRALPWLQSMTVESFLHLCVSLRLASKRPLRTLAVTSPAVGDGKSTVAWNLAKALSNVQPRILLIDGDMRRGSLHEQASCPNDFGLSDVLSGDRSLSESLCEVSPQLDLLTSGSLNPNPVALLQSQQFDALLAEAAERYAMVIIDSPALSCVTDGYLISSRADGTALVIAANTTDERVARAVVSQFDALGINNLVGVVLNKDHQRFHDYSEYFADTYVDALPKGSA